MDYKRMVVVAVPYDEQTFILRRTTMKDFVEMETQSQLVYSKRKKRECKGNAKISERTSVREEGKKEDNNNGMKMKKEW